MTAFNRLCCSDFDTTNGGFFGLNLRNETHTACKIKDLATLTDARTVRAFPRLSLPVCVVASGSDS